MVLIFLFKRDGLRSVWDDLKMEIERRGRKMKISRAIFNFIACALLLNITYDNYLESGWEVGTVMTLTVGVVMLILGFIRLDAIRYIRRWLGLLEAAVVVISLNRITSEHLVTERRFNLRRFKTSTTHLITDEASLVDDFKRVIDELKVKQLAKFTVLICIDAPDDSVDKDTRKQLIIAALKAGASEAFVSDTVLSASDARDLMKK